MNKNIFIELGLLIGILACMIVAAYTLDCFFRSQEKEIDACVETGIDVKTCEYLRTHKHIKINSIRL